MILQFIANAELRHPLKEMGVRTTAFMLSPFFFFKATLGNFTGFIIKKKKRMREYCNQWDLSFTHWIFIIRKYLLSALGTKQVFLNFFLLNDI